MSSQAKQFVVMRTSISPNSAKDLWQILAASFSAKLSPIGILLFSHLLELSTEEKGSNFDELGAAINVPRGSISFYLRELMSAGAINITDDSNSVYNVHSISLFLPKSKRGHPRAVSAERLTKRDK